MLGRSIAFFVCVCGFAAVVVPSPSDDEAQQVRESKSTFSTKPDRTNASSDTGWYAGDHTLERQRDGHFYATAHVDGTPVEMMVDTGASVIALTADDAQAAGLHWTDSEITHIGSGASGAVYGVPARLNEVEIGGMVRRNVDAVIIPEGLGTSLLGQSYLRQIGAVEINGNQMVMSTR